MRWKILSYGFLSAPAAMAIFVLLTYLPSFYAIDKGLGLGLVGVIFAAGRILDGMTDPIIGHMSDNTRTRLGARIPWIIVGIVGFAVSTWLLLVPDGKIGPFYLLLVSSLFFLFYTMFEVPYASTGLEISRDSHERSLLAGSKTFFQVLGVVAVGAVPTMFVGEMDRSLHFSAVIIISACLIGFVLFVGFVPRRDVNAQSKRVRFTTAVKFVKNDMACRTLISAYLVVQSSSALFIALTMLFVSHVMGSDEKLGIFITLFLVSSAVFLPFWVWLSKHHGKAATWRLSIGIGATFLAVPMFAGADNIYVATLFFAGAGATLVCDSVMPTSLLADLVAEHNRKEGGSVAGLYLSLKNTVSKLAFLVPMLIAFPALDLIGFNEANGSDRVADVTFLFFFSGLPVCLRLLALPIMSRWQSSLR